MLKALSYILCDLDPKVQVIGQKRVFAMVYHRLLLNLYIFLSLHPWPDITYLRNSLFVHISLPASLA